MTKLAPYADLLKLRVEERGPGEAPLFIMPFHDDVVGRPGMLHGGAIAGLLEFAAFGALERAIGADNMVMKPITVTVDYMRSGTSRETYASAVVERLGNRIANVEAHAWQTDRSTPIASARMNFLLER